MNPLESPGAWTGTRLPDHRAHYLDYEGPVLGNRGEVRRLWRCMCRLLDESATRVVVELHPDYASTRWANDAVAGNGRLAGLPLVGVQHHHAHIAACLAENDHTGPAIGLSFDGTGYGTDGTICIYTHATTHLIVDISGIWR